MSEEIEAAEGVFNRLHGRFQARGGLTLNELREFGEEFGPDFYDAVTLEATLDCHDVTGGTARARVREALAAAEAQLEKLEAAHAGA